MKTADESNRRLDELLKELQQFVAAAQNHQRKEQGTVKPYVEQLKKILKKHMEAPK